MAWPYDARDKSYGPLTPVPSSNLNAIQDVITAIMGLHAKVLTSAFPQIVSGSPVWEASYGGGGGSVGWWDCVSPGGSLYVPIPVRVQAEIGGGGGSVLIKYWSATTTGPVIDFNVWDLQLGGAGTTPPSFVNLVNLVTGTVTANAWAVFDVVLPANEQIAQGEHWMLKINGVAGDRFAGLSQTFTKFA
jgi:hypothetical protein